MPAIWKEYSVWKLVSGVVLFFDIEVGVNEC
jgi:hypothetical protein